MLVKRFLLLITFILLSSQLSFADTFTVTTNADSGTGSLREALTLAAANGSAVKDFIYFNIADQSEAGRTITLLSLLPQVSSSLVIDGTTQPGIKFGVSDAKIIITQLAGLQLEGCLITATVNNGSPIEFYGLFIRGFDWYNTSAIKISSPAKLILGAPGKGNIISGNRIAMLGDLSNTIIQSNLVGLNIDGETPLANNSIFVAVGFNNLLIGGDNPQEGNVFTGNDEFITLYHSGGLLERAYIKNNFFGTDYTGTKAINGPQSTGSYIYVQGYTAGVTIEKNTFSANQIAISLISQATASVKGNFLGTDKTQTHPLGHNSSEAINLNDFCTMTLGGETENEQNVITNYTTAVFSINFSQCEIIKNHFYCNGYLLLYGSIDNYLVNITKLTNNYAYGNAPAGSKVQLYYSEAGCSTCNPKQWFANVVADDNGHWEYNGSINGKLIISATINHNTVSFAPTYMKQSEVNITTVDCFNVGSIEIAEKREGRFKFIWKNEAGTILGNEQKLNITTAGRYFLEINEDGECPVSLGIFDVGQYYITGYPGSVYLDCNNPTAALYANYSAYPSDNLNFKWEKEDGDFLSNTANVAGLSAGVYYLTITNSLGCTSGKIKYEVFPAPNIPVIDITPRVVTDATCSNSDGAINNVKVTGTGNLYYSWTNQDNVQVGTDLNLINKPAGTYVLTVTVDGGCAPVVSPSIEIKGINGVSLNLTDVQIISTSCGNSNGSIKGLQIINATTVEWRKKSDNALVAGTLDIINQPAGAYVLTISNANCSKSYDFTIEQLPTIAFQDFAATYTKSCAAFGTGTITLNTGNGEQPVAYRWVNSEGMQVGYTNKAEFLPAGDYKLYLTDKNGCENFYKDYHVDAYPDFSITYGTITNAQCGVSTGSISATMVTGGTSIYTYQWLDGNGDPIPGKNQSSLDNLAPGKYTLRITDGGCNLAEPEFTVADISIDPPTPSVTDIDRCSSGTAVIAVNDTYPTAKYRLYETATSAQPIDEQEGGKFTVSVTESKTYYVSLTYGTCESLRAEVKVLLGSITSGIPNTFTPNGDGTNDYWKIKGIENYTNGTVSVFNRAGQLVFQSKGYAVPFDGTRNGKPLPAGVYYYIIDLKSCNLISGNLTLIR